MSEKGDERADRQKMRLWPASAGLVLLLLAGLALAGMRDWRLTPPTPDLVLSEPLLNEEYGDCVDLYEWRFFGWDKIASISFTTTSSRTWGPPFQGRERFCAAYSSGSQLRLPPHIEGLHKLCGVRPECIVFEVR